MPSFVERFFGMTAGLNERAARFQALSLVAESQDRQTWDADVRNVVDALLVKGKPNGLSFGELVTLESSLFRGSSDAIVLPWLRNFEDEYATLLDGSVAVAEATCANDPVATRAAVIAMAAKVQHFRAKRRSLAAMRTTVCLVAVVSAMAFFTAGGVLLNSWHDNGGPRTLALVVVYVGALGGFISGLSRLYSLSWTGTLLWTTQSVTTLGLGVGLNLLVSVLEGAVFALILLVIFCGKLIQGSLFPTFVFDDSPGVSFYTFLRGGAAANADVAKAIAWAFASGFSERLVPDLLSQLTVAAKVPASTTAK